MTALANKEQAVTVRQDQPNETAAIIQVIERAAANPAVDIEKMQRLLDMSRQARADNAKIAFNRAFAQMQPELPAIDKRGKGHNKMAYGLWEDIQSGIQPVLAKHGFALSFKTQVSAGFITVTAILHHEEGHDDSTDLPLPIDTSGSKNNVQAVGSSISYGKRYAACALLNIRVSGEDDDGAAAGGPEQITDEQAMELRELIEAGNSDPKKFCTYFKIEAVSDLPAKDFARAVDLLKRRVKS